MFSMSSFTSTLYSGVCPVRDSDLVRSLWDSSCMKLSLPCLSQPSSCEKDDSPLALPCLLAARSERAATTAHQLIQSPRRKAAFEKLMREKPTQFAPIAAFLALPE
mmetsp:Transcript_145906/g.254544  ORF Transcript_145906/g.254544 Transcript_145906/m.254544 type:complete len:106 (+) Transcript_145906:1827-2144(+)